MRLEKIIPEFLQEFKDRSNRERNYVSLNTLKTYGGNLNMFLSFLKENKLDTNIKKITEDHVLRFMNTMIDRKLAPASRNQNISTLRSFFKWAKKYYKIESPIKEIKCA